MATMQAENVSAERVVLGNGVSVPRSWTVIVREEPGVPGGIRLHVEYDETLGRTAAVAVTVERGGAGDEVTSLTLREVRVQSALQLSGLYVSAVVDRSGDTLTGADFVHRMRERSGRTSMESVADAATTYRLATAVNLPPLKTVAECLGVSQSTATRLMNRARGDGMASYVRLPGADATGPVVGEVGRDGPSMS
jgi:hypothetical protein